MRVRAAIATVLLSLVLTGCSSTDRSATPASNTALPTCTDFNAQTFTGLLVARANDVKALGWSVELAHADSPYEVGYRAPADGTIEGVTKQEFRCVVIFKIRVAPSFATASQTP